MICNTSLFMEFNQVTITILDVNDNRPEFTDSFPVSTTISETAEPGSSVAAIVAVDDDEPGTDNSAVRYSMTDQNQSGLLPALCLFILLISILSFQNRFVTSYLFILFDFFHNLFVSLFVCLFYLFLYYHFKQVCYLLFVC